MEANEQVLLSFHGVEIVNVTYSSQGKAREKLSLRLQVSPFVFYPESEKSQFKILMEVKVEGVDIFNLDLLAISTFELSKLVSDEERKSFVNVNAPAIMFPYIRSFISTFFVNLGTNPVPVILPPQVFKGEIKELELDADLSTNLQQF